MNVYNVVVGFIEEVVVVCCLLLLFVIVAVRLYGLIWSGGDDNMDVLLCCHICGM